VLDEETHQDGRKSEELESFFMEYKPAQAPDHPITWKVPYEDLEKDF